MMSQMTSLLELTILLTLYISRVQCDLVFTSTPGSIQPPVTDMLDMTCSLSDDLHLSVTSSPTRPTSGIIGRAAPEHEENQLSENVPETQKPSDVSNKRSPGSSSTSILHVASIAVSRAGQTVASVSTYTPAKVMADTDKHHLQVTGAVAGVNGSLGHLHLVWTLPTDAQTGEYECKVTGFTELGQVVTLTESLAVEKASIDLDDIIRELHGLKQKTHDQNITMLKQQSTISRLEATASQQQTTIVKHESSLKEQNLKMAAQKAELDSLKNTTSRQTTVINQQDAKLTSQRAEIETVKSAVKEAGHTETGVLWCGDSKTWAIGGPGGYYRGQNYFYRQSQLTASFHSDYLKPPVVFLSVSLLDSSDFTAYGVQLQSVDTRGFSIRCGTSPSYRVFVEVSWLAVAN